MDESLSTSIPASLTMDEPLSTSIPASLTMDEPLFHVHPGVPYPGRGPFPRHRLYPRP